MKMAKFDMEQTMAVVAVQQLINDWAYDLDSHENANVGKVITDDVSFSMSEGLLREGAQQSKPSMPVVGRRLRRAPVPDR